MNGDMNACKSDCTNNVCGDGFVGPGESCDDGNDEDGDDCTNACALATCGDGVMSAGDECDDGNDDNSDGCTDTCTLPVCGDGYIQMDEACDDGLDNSNNALCTLGCAVASCGDGLVYNEGEGDEACDDMMNGDQDDGCTDMCQEPACGDGFTQVNAGEACDDMMNGDQDDGCTDECLEPACGDGFVQQSLGETCDDGNNLPNDGCDPSCGVACQEVNGLTWCYNPDACGEPCNAVCSVYGLTPSNTTAWFEAQNTPQKCQALADAFGIAGTSMASYTYACLEDTGANHANNLFVSPLLCSTFSGCPQNHLTNMDNLGASCNQNSRRSICPCE